MRILAVGNEVEPPRSLTACSSLPPEGAAAPAARQSRFRGPCLIEGPPRAAPARHRSTGLHHAGVTLSLRDSSQTALEREAQRLAVLFESARAQSRASGTAVFWRPTLDGFRFEGLPPGALPTRWLEAGTRAGANVAIQLGPEPIIGAQAVDILSGGQEQSQPARVLRIATDGLRPFALQTAEQAP
jgi:general secretion pathway protein H